MGAKNGLSLLEPRQSFVGLQFGLFGLGHALTPTTTPALKLKKKSHRGEKKKRQEKKDVI